MPEPNETLYLSAKDAATALGISTATLYTYASRGLVRVQREQGQRQSRYWRSDIERLKRRSGSGPSENFGALTGDSSITLVTRTGTYYRGRDVAELAETHSLEQVAALLWDVDVDQVFGNDLPALPALDPGFERQIAPLDFVEKVVALTPFMERANPRCFDPSLAGFAHSGAGMLRWLAGLMTLAGTPSTEPLHRVLVRDCPVAVQDVWAEVTRRLLVLSADHDLDPTTLAARAVANTGVTPYRVMVAGMLTSEGRRGVQGRVRAAEGLLEEMMAARDASEPIFARLRAGAQLPGFGSYIHVGSDTRVEAALATYRRYLSTDPQIISFLNAIDVVREATGLEPQFILVLLAFSRKLKHADAQASLLKIGRVVGWIAHAMEQASQDVARPRSRYRGELPR